MDFCFLVKHNRYNSSASSTYERNRIPFDNSYGSGSASGHLAIDTVRVAGMNISRQSFAETHTENGDTLRDVQFDGIFGLAYESLGRSGRPPLYRMYEQKLIEKPVVSFYLQRNKDVRDKDGGAIIFGGSDPKHYTGNFVYVPVSKTGYWQFRVDNILVGKRRTICKFGCEVMADTGTSMIYGPPDEIRLINGALGETGAAYGLVSVNCDTIDSLPSVTFHINETPFILLAADYILRIGSGRSAVCVSSFAIIDRVFLAGENLPHWILGDMFLSKYYSEYDMEKHRIGFALAVH